MQEQSVNSIFHAWTRVYDLLHSVVLMSLLYVIGHGWELLGLADASIVGNRYSRSYRVYCLLSSRTGCLFPSFPLDYICEWYVIYFPVDFLVCQSHLLVKNHPPDSYDWLHLKPSTWLLLFSVLWPPISLPNISPLGEMSSTQHVTPRITRHKRSWGLVVRRLNKLLITSHMRRITRSNRRGKHL